MNIVVINRDEELKNLVIEIEDVEIDEDMASFNLFAKRFFNVFDIISECIKYVFERDEELDVLNEYLSLNSEVKEGNMDLVTFIEKFKVVVENETLNDIINDYIETSYIHVDNTIDSRKSINKQLVLSEQHCIDLQKIGFSMKFFIPIISSYFAYNQIEVKTINSLYLTTFSLIINHYNENNVLYKLYKLVESRVSSTQYSDRIIWIYLQNIGKDPKNTTLAVLYKTITLILYKLDASRNPISYIHAALKKQITFVFKENIPIEYSPVNPRIEDSDGITALDKMQIDFARIDEGMLSIQNINKSTELKNFIKNNSYVSISAKDIEYYKDLELNKFQVNLVFLYFAKYFKSYDMYDISKDEFTLLTIALKQVLEKKFKLNILAKYLTAYGDFKSKKIIMKKDFLIKLAETRIYNKIFNEYKFASSKFLENKDPVLFQISTIYFNKWLTYDDKVNGVIEFSEPTEKLEEISYEVLNFINQI